MSKKSTKKLLHYRLALWSIPIWIVLMTVALLSQGLSNASTSIALALVFAGPILLVYFIFVWRLVKLAEKSNNLGYFASSILIIQMLYFLYAAIDNLIKYQI